MKVVEHVSHCLDCGRVDAVWFAPSELWNRVVGSPNGVLCPSCFIDRAEAAGVVPTAWRVAPEDHADEDAS